MELLQIPFASDHQDTTSPATGRNALLFLEILLHDEWKAHSEQPPRATTPWRPRAACGEDSMLRSEGRLGGGDSALPTRHAGRAMKHDPLHPIIERPHEYRIVDMRYYIGFGDEEPFLDLFLSRGSTVRRLRFWSPSDLEIEKGFPGSTSGMQIFDVRDRQMDGLGVRVEDFEASWGAITFWAREVVDLDTIEAD